VTRAHAGIAPGASIRFGEPFDQAKAAASVAPELRR
jgi:hypothetical protein